MKSETRTGTVPGAPTSWRRRIVIAAAAGMLVESSLMALLWYYGQGAPCDAFFVLILLHLPSVALVEALSLRGQVMGLFLLFCGQAIVWGGVTFVVLTAANAIGRRRRRNVPSAGKGT